MDSVICVSCELNQNPVTSLRQSLRDKITRVCDDKIQKSGDQVGLSFYAFFANKNTDAALLMEAADWWINDHKLDHFVKATQIKALVLSEQLAVNTTRLKKYQAAVEQEVPDSVRETIVRLVVEYNNSKAGPSHGRPLFVVLRDQDANVCGGLSGATGRGWLFIDHLVVPEAARGQGMGKMLVTLAEQEAVNRHCRSAWLNTFEFQARGFYEKLGYSCFGELADYPPGFSRFFMSKSLLRP